jgi:hypothetical protein
MEPREDEEDGRKPVADLKLCSSRKTDKETFVGHDEYSMGMTGLILSDDECNPSQANKRMPNVQNVDANKVLIEYVLVIYVTQACMCC